MEKPEASSLGVADQVPSKVFRNLSPALGLGPAASCISFPLRQALSFTKRWSPVASATSYQFSNPTGKSSKPLVCRVSLTLASLHTPRGLRHAARWPSLGPTSSSGATLWVQLPHTPNEGGWFFDGNSDSATWKRRNRCLAAKNAIKHLLQNFK